MRFTPSMACALGLLTSVISMGAVSAETSPPRTTIAAGTVEGLLPAAGPGAVFKGIPYAQPPVGDLRWREPLPARPWRGIKLTTSFAPACAQASRSGPTGSEDCLYLNVWTPEWPTRPTASAGHPVMLWIFGGANMTGSGNAPIFDGAALARRGVVVVTANYRVGVMGFLAHPELSATSHHRSSGNYQLLDQLMALRWIKQNIRKFGGDPRRVTLFGQSSGAYDLLLLMTSPLSKGLFSRAIAESGQFLAYDGPMPKSRAEEIGIRIAADLNAPGGARSISYLRSLPADRIITAAARWLRTEPGTDTGLLTNVDGWVLPSHPARAFANGRQLPIPLIIGNNAREITPQTSSEELRQQIATKYGELAPHALQAYGLDNGGAGHADPLLGSAAAQWMTDIVQRCPAIVEANWHAARFPTWQYQFERSIPGREAMGATHGAEVAFVFGTLDSMAPDKPAFTSADYLASEQMQEYWTRFAKSGDPNSTSATSSRLPDWPRAGGGDYLAFTSDGPIAKQNLQPLACGVYRDWVQRKFLN